MPESNRNAEMASLYPELTFRQIGERYGVSGQRVQQILKRMGYTSVPSRVTPVAERFWPKVAKGEGCWEWQGSRMPNGYGHMRTLGSGVDYTHRVSWELHNGPIPAGLNVLHHCDNPPCVRPDHLYVGTQTDNMNDRARRGRTRGGPNAPGTLAKSA